MTEGGKTCCGLESVGILSQPESKDCRFKGFCPNSPLYAAASRNSHLSAGDHRGEPNQRNGVGSQPSTEP